MSRILDRELLNLYHGEPCLVCKSTIGTVAHHIKGRGAFGDDVEYNLMPLCQQHHLMIHSKGLIYMANHYSPVGEFLKDNGWVFDDFSNKYLHS